MSDLVKRLSQGVHPVEVSLRPERTLDRLRECVSRGYVHIKFTDTRGGTELGVRLNKEEPAEIRGDTGTVRLSGRLSLDYVPVLCVADIDLGTFRGTGRLEVVADSHKQALNSQS